VSALQRPPARITRAYLLRSASRYLERWFAPRAHLRQLMMRRVRRSAAHHGDELDELEPILDEVLDHLERLGALNDQAFAEGKAQSLIRKGLPERAIRQKLSQKGVSSELVEQQLTARRESAEDAELDAALRYARRRRLGPWSTSAPSTDRPPRDLARMARAGFPYSVVQRVIALSTSQEAEALLDELTAEPR